MDFFKGGNLHLSMHLTRAAGMQIFDKIVHCVTAAAHLVTKKMILNYVYSPVKSRNILKTRMIFTRHYLRP